MTEEVRNFTYDTNNGAELRVFIQGLRSAACCGYSKLIAEGDSQLIIQMLSKLQNVSSPNKVSTTRRLPANLTLQSEVSCIPFLIVLHVRRHKWVADHLANEGVKLIMGDHDRAWETSPTDILTADCHKISSTRFGLPRWGMTS